MTLFIEVACLYFYACNNISFLQVLFVCAQFDSKLHSNTFASLLFALLCLRLAYINVDL